MEEQFRTILKKYFEGTATAKEKKVVDDFFETMQKDGISAEKVSHNQLLTRRLDDKVYAKTIHRSQSRRRTVWAAAASLLIIFSVSLFLYIKHENARATTTVIAQNGKQLKVTLPDSSIAYLNSASTITYPNGMGNGGDRHIKLSGEAYFEVTHDAVHPFIVESSTMKTQVLGTRFVVHDYTGEAPCVVVRSGKVGVALAGKEDQTILTQNEGVFFNKGIAQLEQVNAQDYYSWKDGNIVFDQANLKQVISTLNRRFNVRISLTSGFSEKCTITGSYYDRNLYEILKSLRFIYGIEYTVAKNGEIYLKTNPC